MQVVFKGGKMQTLSLFKLLGALCALGCVLTVILTEATRRYKPAPLPVTSETIPQLHVNLTPTIRNNSSNISNDPNRTKTIVLWSTYYKYRDWQLPALGSAPFDKCPHKNCVVSTNHSVMDADLVLFHCRGSFTLPTTRSPHQIYTMICGESPTYTNNMARFGRAINMTMSYRLDADVLDRLSIQPREHPLSEPYNPKVPFKTKTKDVVWLVSHCTTASQREVYTKHLARHIGLDKYGACGALKCPRKQNVGCFKDFEKKYKYYLSFENSVCRDYVTEKLFNPFLYELIPIVLGGADYSQIAPAGSYINIRDFPSPKHLAKYLSYLSNNETAYYEYFKWKQTMKIAQRPGRFCKLCEILTEGKFQRDSSSRHIGDWYSPDGVCDNDMVSRLLRMKGR